VAITCDPAKDAKNIRERGISLSRFAEMEHVIARPSPRANEARVFSMGLIDGVVHVGVHVTRGRDVHVISLRRASRKERKEYAHATS
jgi:uncharacterized DUF497 family protein